MAKRIIKWGEIFNTVDTKNGTVFAIKNLHLFNLVKDVGGFNKDSKWQS